MAWLLREVATALPGLRATTRWNEFLMDRANMFIWEAFASNKTQEMRHDYDAKAILRAFSCWVDAGSRASQITAVHPILLAGLAILWAGLSDDISLLMNRALL